MKTENAQNLEEFIRMAYDTYNNFWKNPDYYPDIKSIYNQQSFEIHFQNYLKELRENILVYEDYRLIEQYVDAFFENIHYWISFNKDEEKWTIQRGIEVKFLLQFKKNIQWYAKKIEHTTQSVIHPFNIIPETLGEIFNDVLHIEPPKIDAPTEFQGISDEPDTDPRFHFDQFKAELNGLNIVTQKIKLITERLFDLEQWQLQNDNLINEGIFGSFYEFSSKYYPNFVELCNIELKRCQKLQELDKKLPTFEINESDLKPTILNYHWVAKDTDLLELIVALMKTQSLERTDGKKLTRKDLLQYFQDIFGVQIKDAESKLSKATERQKGAAPYLESLLKAFETYAYSK